MDLKRGTTIATLDEICFPVELIDNPNKTNREYSKIVVGEVDGEDMDLNYCSPRYELVPNEMIFPKVEEIFTQHGIKFDAEYSHTDHARFYGNFIVEDSRFAYKMAGTNDEIKFLWSFQHSYNGLTKYKGLCGFHRVVCTNGLTVPVQEMQEYNLALEGKHTASILRSLEEFSQILVNVTNNLGQVKTAVTSRYETLGKRWMDGHGGKMVKRTEDRITEVLKATGINIVDRPTLRTMPTIMAAINKEAKKVGFGYNGRINDWLIYNGINQYIHDDKLNIASPEKRRDKDSKVLEYMLEYA